MYVCTVFLADWPRLTLQKTANNMKLPKLKERALLVPGRPNKASRHEDTQSAMAMEAARRIATIRKRKRKYELGHQVCRHLLDMLWDDTGDNNESGQSSRNTQDGTQMSGDRVADLPGLDSVLDSFVTPSLAREMVGEMALTNRTSESDIECKRASVHQLALL